MKRKDLSIAIAAFIIYSLLIVLPLILSFMRNETPASETHTVLKGFTATAYCPHECCNGKWAGKTATGKDMDYYTSRNINIVAVDPEIIPLGTKIQYQGKEYLAADVGRLIKGKKIDVLLPDHKSTIIFGKKTNQAVTIIKESHQ